MHALFRIILFVIFNVIFSRDRDWSPPPEKSVHGIVVTPEASWGNGWKIQPSNVAVTLLIVASISAHYNYYD